MSFTTLAVAQGPTLADGLVELLRIGEALTEAAGEDCGVSLYVGTMGELLEVEPDPELPEGVLGYVARIAVADPWSPTDWADAARLELLELLAHVNPDRDLLATADGVGYLG